MDIPSSPIAKLDSSLNQLVISGWSENNTDDTGPSDVNCSSINVNVENILLTPPKEESTTTSLARNVITANELFTTRDYYRTRTLSLPCNNVRNLLGVSNIVVNKSCSCGDLEDIDVDEWCNNDRFKQCDSNSKSRELDEDENKAPDQVDIAVHNQACVVVHTQNDQPELFGEDDNKPEKLENEILSRTKNKLYDIFIKQCGNKEPTCFEMS